MMKSKIIAASCQGNTVTADGVPVPVAQILSKGVGASEGILVLEGEKAWYIPKSVMDLEDTLAKVITALADCKEALDLIATSITSLDHRGFLISADNGVPDTPKLDTTVAEIESKAAAIEDTKQELEQLKEVLK